MKAIKQVAVDGELMFVYQISWGEYEEEASALVAHPEMLSDTEIRKRFSGGVVSSLRQPFPPPERLHELGFIKIESITINPGYLER